MTAIDNLFARGVRMVHAEAVEMTLASLRAYWDRHQHVAVAWSGGKDSTLALTLLIHFIDSGELPQPERLYVLYADTRQELPPIQASAELSKDYFADGVRLLREQDAGRGHATLFDMMGLNDPAPADLEGEAA